MTPTIWKGRLNFGLVSLPIKLIRAARAEKIHMHKLQRETGSRVKQFYVPAEAAPLNGESPKAVAAKEEEGEAAPRAVEKPSRTAEPVKAKALSNKDVVQGYEYEKGHYVQFEPEELAKIAPRTSPDMQIVEFVKFDEVDPVYLETSYYVLPDKGGEKPYELLFAALKKTGFAAIGEFVMHRRDQVIILRTGKNGLIAHTLFYEDEVKRASEYHVEKGLTTGKELDLAIKLVEALAGKFEPEKFKDQYRERLKHAISEKVETGAVTEAEEPAKGAPVIDIMAALQQSLAKARKPVSRESHAAPAKRKRAAGR
ncbi:MAG TPA: Ku protein [Bryobacteraceae bacterium]|jgi:DNA end-binding protein Ku